MRKKEYINDKLFDMGERLKQNYAQPVTENTPQEVSIAPEKAPTSAASGRSDEFSRTLRDLEGRIANDRAAVEAELNELEPAYAMTVHKSQGSEYRAVVLSAWNGPAPLMNRSVLYTAITRARTLLIVVGREETVEIMTHNAKTSRRYTGLKLRLQENVK